MLCHGIKEYYYWFNSYVFLNIDIVEIKMCWDV